MSSIGSTPLNGAPSVGSPSEASTIGSRPSNVRHSVDGLRYVPETTTATSDTSTSSIASPPGGNVSATPPKLQQSYSANEVSTVKTNGSAGLGTNANNHAQQHLHNHNASLGRIPPGAMPNRHTRELSGDGSAANGREPAGYPSITSTLQANAPPFGPVSGQPLSSGTTTPTVTAPTPAMPYPFYPPAPNYNPVNGPPAGYNNLPMLMQNLSVSNANPSAMYSQQNFPGYGHLYNPAPAPRQSQDSQARVIQSRRQMDSEGDFRTHIFKHHMLHGIANTYFAAMARFNNLPLEQVGGTIYSLCKDQHGCRYLQKQLENRIPEQIHMIWLETNQHVMELMTDPFGNYLCQKLVEYCSDEERTVLIQNASVDMK